MNRREFTASLAALAATPAIPLVSSAAATPAALPPGAYLWAELIARAQNACSPAMIARHLGVSASAAEGLFNQMLRDGVIKAPGMAGVAQAAKPLHTSGAHTTAIRKVANQLNDLRDHAPTQEPTNGATPLVKDAKAGLGCDDAISPKDNAHASPDQPPEESPESG